MVPLLPFCHQMLCIIVLLSYNSFVILSPLILSIIIFQDYCSLQYAKVHWSVPSTTSFLTLFFCLCSVDQRIWICNVKCISGFFAFNYLLRMAKSNHIGACVYFPTLSMAVGLEFSMRSAFFLNKVFIMIILYLYYYQCMYTILYFDIIKWHCSVHTVFESQYDPKK